MKSERKREGVENERKRKSESEREQESKRERERKKRERRDRKEKEKRKQRAICKFSCRTAGSPPTHTHFLPSLLNSDSRSCYRPPHLCYIPLTPCAIRVIVDLRAAWLLGSQAGRTLAGKTPSTSSMYNDFKINLTRLSSLATTNTLAAVPHRVVYITLRDADWRTFDFVCCLQLGASGRGAPGPPQRRRCTAGCSTAGLTSEPPPRWPRGRKIGLGRPRRRWSAGWTKVKRSKDLKHPKKIPQKN